MVVDNGSGLLWGVSIGTVFLLWVPELLADVLKFSAKITFDVIEEMQDLGNLKECLRNVYSSVALISALLLTIAATFISVDPPTDEDSSVLGHIFIVSSGFSFSLCMKSAVESVIHIVYTEALTPGDALRYLIAQPYSVGGPVLTVCTAMTSLNVARMQLH